MLWLIFPFLLPDGSYGYFTREVENQHGTPCNGHGACNITMDTLGPGTSDAFLSMSSPFLQERRSVIMTPVTVAKVIF